MKNVRKWICLLSMATSGCLTLHPSTPPDFSGSAPPTAEISPRMPAPDYLPDLSATVPNTRFVLIQPEGGSLLLGPLFGALNIADNTSKMAEQYQNTLLSIDPALIAEEALKNAELLRAGTAPAFTISPYVRAHLGDDKLFRLLYIFHVERRTGDAPWIGRYVYHMPVSYSAASFNRMSSGEVGRFKTELAKGAKILTELFVRDLLGELPATGKQVNFGSLHLIANKVGGIGIYSYPHEMYFPYALLIEETKDYAILRLKGMYNASVFGLHYSNKSLIHTLKPNQQDK